MDHDVTARLEQHVAFLRRIARELVRHGEDPDDIVQDALLVQLNHGPRDEKKRSAWLAGVVRHLVRSRRRGEAGRRDRELAYVQSKSAEVPPGRHAEHQEQVQQFSRALAALGDRQYEALYQRYFNGLMPREIARELGLPVTTVKRRLERALEHLRGELSRDDPDWRHGVGLLAAIPAAEIGVKSSLKGLALGAIAMKKTVVVAGAMLVIALVSLRLAAGPEDRLDPPRSGEIDEYQAVEVRRTPSERSAAEEVANARTELPPAEVQPGLPGSMRVLRVVLEGITDEEARTAKVTVTGVDGRRDEWPSHIGDAWPALGLTSEFDLDPFFARVAGATNWDLRLDELEVKVCHPLHAIERIRVPLSKRVVEDGRTVYEIRVPLVPGVPYVFWPEATLAVRDASTRAHLEDVELRFVPSAFMGLGQVPGTAPVFTSLGGGLSSPIALLAGREADAPDDMAGGLALGPAAGEAPRLLELVQPEATARGIVVYARAPGYAWGRIVLDVSTGAERELLLGPAATLDVRLLNVQPERYAALETDATLWVDRLDPRGGNKHRAWHQRLDETLESDGIRLESLEPGDYAISVKLGAWSWKEPPVLAREELALAAGESREVVLELADPPPLPARAHLGGVISFPAFGGEEKVRLQLYEAGDHRFAGRSARYRPTADVELSLDDLERVGGSLPTWSFRVEDIPVGLYQVQLEPFLKSWMTEVPAGGRDDVEFVIPELAEVFVETVDARTGERIPIDKIYYRHQEVLPKRVQIDRARADLEEPGRFHFWTAPGAALIYPHDIPSDLQYGLRWEEFKLVPGVQSVRFELEPVYAMRFEFRDDGAALPMDDQVGVFVSRGIRAVGHDGRVTRDGLQSDMHVEVSAPGVYAISFDGVGGDRYHPVPPRRVEVRAGETTEVIVDLRRK